MIDDRTLYTKLIQIYFTHSTMASTVYIIIIDNRYSVAYVCHSKVRRFVQITKTRTSETKVKRKESIIKKLLHTSEP